MFEFNDEQIGGGQNVTIQRYEGVNGLRLVLIKVEDVLSFWGKVMVKIGSRHEDPEHTGTAHFLEHMMFKGTKSMSSAQLVGTLDKYGCVYNAATNYDSTFYYLGGAYDDAQMMLKILLDLFLNPTLPDEEITKERNVVMEELRMYKDQHDELLMDAVREAMFSKYNDTIARSIIGKPEHVQKLTRDDILAMREKYRPSNTIIVLAGNFDAFGSIDNLVQNVAQSFGTELTAASIPANPDLLSSNLKIPYYNPKSKPNFVGIKDNSKEQTLINLAYYNFNVHSKWLVELNLLTDILYGGMSSRLFKLLREQLGVSYGGNAISYAIDDTGVFAISVGVEPPAVEKVIQEILALLETLVVTPEELETVKKSKRVGVMLKPLDPDDHMNITSHAELYGLPYRTIEEKIQRINQVKLEDVQRLVEILFNRHNATLGVLGQYDEANVKNILLGGGNKQTTLQNSISAMIGGN